MEKIEVKASSVEKAIEEGLKELGIERENAEIEVLQEGGLFSKAVVTVQRKETPADIVIDFLNGLFERMNLRCYADCEVKDEEIVVNITGSDSGVIIGYRGEVLDAIQYLALILVNESGHNFIRVSINAENYREKRIETLESLANRLAYKAYSTRRKVELEPMNPIERRVIHTALQNSKYATTESEGEDMNRHIVIVPKEGGVCEGYEERNGRRNDGRRNDGRRNDGRRNDRNRRNDSRDRRGNRNDSRQESAPVKPVDDPTSTEFNLKKNGPPKFKSFGYTKKHF